MQLDVVDEHAHTVSHADGAVYVFVLLEEVFGVGCKLVLNIDLDIFVVNNFFFFFENNGVECLDDWVYDLTSQHLSNFQSLTYLFCRQFLFFLFLLLQIFVFLSI